MRNGLLLIAVTAVVMGCSKTDSASQTSRNSTAAPPAAAVATNDLMAKLPVYPGAASAVAENTTVSGKHVQQQIYTTPDSFDKVYKWYQAALPAKFETAHDISQSQESAVFTMSGGTTQQSVSILKTSGVEVINITLTVTKE